MTDSKTKYCVNCGSPLPQSANYCQECGFEEFQHTDTKSGPSESPEETPLTEERVESVDDSDTRFANRIPGIDKKYSTRRNAITAGGYLVGGLILLGNLTQNANNNLQQRFPDAFHIDQSTGIVLQSATGRINSYSVEVVGIAINGSNKDYGYVGLEFSLYDSSDIKIGTALANTTGLAAGEKWRFEAIGLDAQSVSSFSVEQVTASNLR
jgi:hypothetical protein